jgi:hypothetical protein
MTTYSNLDEAYQLLRQRVTSLGPLTLLEVHLVIAFTGKLYSFLLSEGLYGVFVPCTSHIIRSFNQSQYITIRVKDFVVQVVIEATSIITFDQFSPSSRFTHQTIQSLVDNLHGAEERYCLYLKERARVRIIGQYCRECHYSTESGKYCGLGIVLEVEHSSHSMCYQKKLINTITQ